MSNFKVGVIGTPGKWSTEVLADELEKLTGFRRVMDIADLAVHSTGRLHDVSGEPLDLDAVVIKKLGETYSHGTQDRAEVLRLVHSSGVRMFSSPQAIARLVNRATCTTTLLAGGIPMPQTVMTESVEHALGTVKKFGQAVLKPLFSTKARGMLLLDATAGEDEAHLREALTEFQSANPMMYIQQRAELDGQDLGLVFLGGNYLGAYARVGAKDSWKTTIHAGGKYAPAQPTDEMIEIATRAQALFGLDFTTVDVALTPDGPIVFEVSAFGGFSGAKQGAELDAPKLYAQYILDQLKSAQ